VRCSPQLSCSGTRRLSDVRPRWGMQSEDISTPPAGGEFGLGPLRGAQHGGSGEGGDGVALHVIGQGRDHLKADGGAEHDDVDQPGHLIGTACEVDRDWPRRAVDGDLLVVGQRDRFQGRIREGDDV
jgi:hypothetical protein